jgi:hypothetical protein
MRFTAMGAKLRSQCAPAAALLAFAIASFFVDASIRPGRFSVAPSTRHVGFGRHRGAFADNRLNVLNFRGGSDENESKTPVSDAQEDKDEVAAASSESSAATVAPKTKGWFIKKKQESAIEEQKQENNQGYVEFTMNSDGQTTNIELQAPALQHELNKTLNNLNELQNKIKEQGQEEFSKLISANGVANGGASSTEPKHMSAKFPITREELPHFACMSVLMFLFIYVFTTGELVGSLRKRLTYSI